MRLIDHRSEKRIAVEVGRSFGVVGPPGEPASHRPGRPVEHRKLVGEGGPVFRHEAKALVVPDAAPGDVVFTLRVFEVIGTDPQSLADRAQRLYAEQTADTPNAPAVSVEVDRDNGVLLAVAEDEALFQFAAILNELQDAVAAPPDVRLIALEYADAATVAEFLRGLASSELAMAAGRSGPPPGAAGAGLAGNRRLPGRYRRSDAVE